MSEKDSLAQAPKTLPDGWRKVKLGDVVCNVNMSERNPLGNGLERFVGLEHIDPGSLQIKRWGMIKDGTTFTRKFIKGQVLFGKRRSYQGKLAIADFDGVCSGDILVFESKDGKLIPELLPFIVQNNDFFDFAIGTSSGSLSPRTKWKHLASYEFPIPPKDEQCRIADILWAAEDCIVKNKKLVDEIEFYKKILMNELFIKGIGHKEFKDTEIGRIPEEWEIKRLEDVSIKLTDGSHFSPRESQNGNYRIATVANIIKGNQIDIDSCKRISNQDYEMLVKNGCKAKKGDVLFSKDGTIGLSFSYKQNEDIVLLSSIAIISPAENLDSDYCAYVLKSPFVFKQITGNMKGTGLKRIILHDLKRIKIPLPSIAEQRIIAGILFKLEDTIQKVQENIDKTKELKKMLLNKFLNCGFESAVSINPQAKQIYETQVRE